MENQNYNRLRKAQQTFRRIEGLKEKNRADYDLLGTAAANDLPIEGVLKALVEKLERVLEKHRKGANTLTIKTRVKF
jgi:hypothetical protein